MHFFFIALCIVALTEATHHTYRRYGGGAIPLHVEDPPIPTVRPKIEPQPIPPPPVVVVNHVPEPNVIVFAEPVHLHVRNVMPYIAPQLPVYQPIPIVKYGI